MKILMAILIILFIILQYELWFSKGGVTDVVHLKKIITKQKVINQKVEQKNQKLSQNIRNLKNNKQAVEARARQELGMVKKGETFYQVVNRNGSK